MNVLMVINPVAGAGRALSKARVLADILAARGHRVDSVETAAGRVLGLKERLDARQPEVIVAAGGDGTLTMLANELSDPSAVPVAFLPAGTANQVSRDLGLPGDPRETALLVEQGAVLRLDVAEIDPKRFLFNASAGFDALVCQRIARAEMSTLGYRGYALPVLRALARYRAPELLVSVDGRQAVQCGYVLVANIRNYGGMFEIAHRAAPTDGLLDVVALASGSIGSILRLGLYGAAGRVSKLPGVTYLTGKSVKITSREPAWVQADGEFFGETPIEIGMLAVKMPILVPRL